MFCSMDKKLKVVWLCHFISDELNEYFNTKENIGAYWMTQFLDIMRNRDVEIHVVAPNYYTNRDVEFELNGISYHLYKYYSGLINSTRYAYFELALRDEKNIVSATSKYIDEINPNIVHLFGAENITYSRGILPYIGKIPTVVSFQGYIQLAELKGSFARKYAIRKRVRTENEILSTCPYVTFGDFEGFSKRYYLEHYGKGKVFNINFSFKKVDIDATRVKKEYDIVFWGRVTVDKGVEDLIQAVQILKDKKPNVKCLILGGGSEEYRAKLDKIVSDNNLKKNVIFGGFQKTDEDLFNNASKAKVYVLPTHYDALPGSIREGMYMKLPVISYPVGDIPELNKEKECIQLAKYKDIEDLADKIDILLSDEDKYQKQVENAYDVVSLTGSEDYIAGQFMTCYQGILESI